MLIKFGIDWIEFLFFAIIYNILFFVFVIRAISLFSRSGDGTVNVQLIIQLFRLHPIKAKPSWSMGSIFISYVDQSDIIMLRGVDASQNANAKKLIQSFKTLDKL